MPELSAVTQLLPIRQGVWIKNYISLRQKRAPSGKKASAESDPRNSYGARAQIPDSQQHLTLGVIWYRVAEGRNQLDINAPIATGEPESHACHRYRADPGKPRANKEGCLPLAVMRIAYP